MLSMTGYGRGEYRQGGIELSVEIKTVNNRYLDASFKCPKIFAAYEEAMRAKLREKMCDIKIASNGWLTRRSLPDRFWMIYGDG